MFSLVLEVQFRVINGGVVLLICTLCDEITGVVIGYFHKCIESSLCTALGTVSEINRIHDSRGKSKHSLNLLHGSCIGHFSSRNIWAGEHWWNWFGWWHAGARKCVCACVRHWVVLLLESHWRAVKVLHVASGTISVQVCACKPSKQSAGCEREVMHHWCRNTNMELSLFCSLVSLLGLSFPVFSCDLQLWKFRSLPRGWKYSTCDTYGIDFEFVCGVIQQAGAHAVHNMQNKKDL